MYVHMHQCLLTHVCMCADTCAYIGEVSFCTYHLPCYFEAWSYTVLEFTKQGQLARYWAPEVYLPIATSLGLELEVSTITPGFFSHGFWGLDLGWSKHFTDWAIPKASPLFWIRGQLLFLEKAPCQWLIIFACCLSYSSLSLTFNMLIRICLGKDLLLLLQNADYWNLGYIECYLTKFKMFSDIMS